MTTPTIPDEAIEAAAKALLAADAPNFPWKDLTPEAQARYMGAAQHVLEAAAPYLESAMIEAGWQEPEKPYIDDRAGAPWLSTAGQWPPHPPTSCTNGSATASTTAAGISTRKSNRVSAAEWDGEALD